MMWKPNGSADADEGLQHHFCNLPNLWLCCPYVRWMHPKLCRHLVGRPVGLVVKSIEARAYLAPG